MSEEDLSEKQLQSHTVFHGKLLHVKSDRVRLPNGAEAPLSTIARWTEGRGYASIDRSDRRRIVTVTADIDEERGDAKGVNDALRAEVLPALVRDIPGLGFSFEGAERERMDSLASLASAMGFALLEKPVARVSMSRILKEC